MRRIYRSAFTAILSAGAILAAAACDRGPARSSEPVTFAVSADSIIEMERDTLPTGDIRVECPLTLTADVAGPEGEHAVVRGGRIEYVWWQTGGRASSYEWNPDAIVRFWGDSIVPVGDARLSRSHGFGQSAPGAPVRGSVIFRYATSNNEEERETEPFRFYCY